MLPGDIVAWLSAGVGRAGENVYTGRHSIGTLAACSHVSQYVAGVEST